MEIRVAESAGFCWGVKRAVNIAVDAIGKTKKTYCLGELIHNRREIERLKKLGMEFIEDMEALESVIPLLSDPTVWRLKLSISLRIKVFR